MKPPTSALVQLTALLLILPVFFQGTAAISANRLIVAQTAVKVAKSSLTITPVGEWNKLGARPGRNAETWTLDGPALNDLSFIGGLEDGKTLIREVDRRNRPLPRFSKTMLPTDIVTLFEGTYRIAADTALFTIGKVEPIAFAGQPGISFAYEFTRRDEVKRRGEAAAVIIGGRLFLMSFEGPSLHYFDRDIARYRQMVASARVE